MRVNVDTWAGVRQMDLADALAPDKDHEGGVAERAASNADTALDCLGRLAALMVERGVCSIEEAADAMRVYSPISKVE